MIKYDDLKKEIRKRKNEYYWEKLKVALTNCPNAKFYNYIIAFAKPFLKGNIERNKVCSDNSFIMHDDNFKSYMWVSDENDKLEVIIKTSPLVKGNNGNTFYRKVVFSNNLITLIDRIKYENGDEKTTFSLFQNSCQINELGENYLVCQIKTDTSTNDEKCLKRVEALRINEENEAIIEEWNSESRENKYYKASNVFTVFENVLSGDSLYLNKEEATYLEAINFSSSWLKENFDYGKRIYKEQKGATKEIKNLTLF